MQRHHIPRQLLQCLNFMLFFASFLCTFFLHGSPVICFCRKTYESWYVFFRTYYIWSVCEIKKLWSYILKHGKSQNGIEDNSNLPSSSRRKNGCFEFYSRTHNKRKMFLFLDQNTLIYVRWTNIYYDFQMHASQVLYFSSFVIYILY